LAGPRSHPAERNTGKKCRAPGGMGRMAGRAALCHRWIARRRSRPDGGGSL